MTMEISELLTIIIPSRTIDFLLEECINKIRELYKDIKIIIILDEVDKSSYLNSDTNIKIIKSNNPNMSAKRNLGVNNSNTKYIAFLDSDSYPTEAKWAVWGINYLENNPLYCAVTGNQFNPKSDNFEQKCLRLVRFSPLFTHKEWCIIIDENAKEQDVTEFMTSNAIMRRDVYINIGGMNENIYLAEDNEFSQRLINKGYKIRFIPQISVFHRESTLIPFLRKIYCMSYYYANMFIKGKRIKDLKKSIYQFIPLACVLFFCVILFVFCKLNMNLFVLLILPMFAFVYLIKEAHMCAKKLEEHKIKGFLLILYTFCAFSVIWVTGTLLGSINFPVKDIRQYYKHY